MASRNESDHPSSPHLLLHPWRISNKDVINKKPRARCVGHRDAAAAFTSDGGVLGVGRARTGSRRRLTRRSVYCCNGNSGPDARSASLATVRAPSASGAVLRPFRPSAHQGVRTRAGPAIMRKSAALRILFAAVSNIRHRIREPSLDPEGRSGSSTHAPSVARGGSGSRSSGPAALWLAPHLPPRHGQAHPCAYVSAITEYAAGAFARTPQPPQKRGAR